jgi:hypothetical protein
MKTKKVKVVVNPVLKNECNGGEAIVIQDNFIFSPDCIKSSSLSYQSYGHIELYDDAGELCGTTNKELIKNWPYGVLGLISDGFVSKYIKLNGNISEVLIEVEPVMCDEFGNDVYKVKLSKKGTVIIHPIDYNDKTIPYSDIKDIISQLVEENVAYSSWTKVKSVEAWLKANNH